MEENYQVLSEQIQNLSQQLQLKKKPSYDVDDIIDIYGVKKLTGLAKQTIYWYSSARTIPSFKFGERLLRFYKTEIIEWMMNRSQLKN